MNDDVQPQGAYALALDVGGTFTDVILAARDGSGYWVTKSSSVPQDPSLGFFGGVDKVMALSRLTPDAVGVVMHGSTVATNAILEGKGARTGVLTTKGFRYVLEIGRADIPRAANLYGWVKPKRSVRPRHIYEIAERVRVDGRVTTELDENGLAAVAEYVRRDQLEALAIVFLNSFANPEHERRAAELLSRHLPGVEISVSSEVLPLFREYERALATVMNASVQPIAGRYIGRLANGLVERKIAAPFFIMKSNGGVFPPGEATRQPVHLALSGPAAGARGAAHVGRRAGLDNLITIDMGGTSADVALIRDGEPAVASTGRVGEFPLALAMIDIHTIGAGGGSIATVNELGVLRVGPESAGAAPGPAAYGKGGRRATVTDANLVLGRLPGHLLDGEVALDQNAAARAVEEHVARPLGLSLEAAARGIIDIVDNNMVGALKVMSVERGLDPSDFTLAAFGGAGPVHGARLMRLLGTPRLLVPRYPGILCAMGLLATDLRYDFAVTRLQRAPGYDIPEIKRAYAELQAEADARLQSDAIPQARRRFRRSADLRYHQQGVEIAVPFEADDVTAQTLAQLVEAFHVRHYELYTFADPNQPVEIVNLRIEATGLMDHVALPEIEKAPAMSTPRPAGTRRATLAGAEPESTPTYRREDLLAGHTITGPAIVDQLDTTTGILPGQMARVDAYGNLIIEEVRP
ncbi:MAG: hydantoinase/oxoprolinase family protein [Hyphomicrobiaceae bacterium]